MWNLPGPGIEPCSLHWQADSYPLSHQESPEIHPVVSVLHSFLRPSDIPVYGATTFFLSIPQLVYI